MVTTASIAGLHQQTQVQNRTDAIAQLRTALERIDRDIRSAYPLLSASVDAALSCARFRARHTRRDVRRVRHEPHRQRDRHVRGRRDHDGSREDAPQEPRRQLVQCSPSRRSAAMSHPRAAASNVVDLRDDAAAPSTSAASGTITVRMTIATAVPGRPGRDVATAAPSFGTRHDRRRPPWARRGQHHAGDARHRDPDQRGHGRPRRRHQRPGANSPRRGVRTGAERAPRPGSTRWSRGSRRRQTPRRKPRSPARTPRPAPRYHATATNSAGAWLVDSVGTSTLPHGHASTREKFRRPSPSRVSTPCPCSADTALTMGTGSSVDEYDSGSNGSNAAVVVRSAAEHRNPRAAGRRRCARRAPRSYGPAATNGGLTMTGTDLPKFSRGRHRRLRADRLQQPGRRRDLHRRRDRLRRYSGRPLDHSAELSGQHAVLERHRRQRVGGDRLELPRRRRGLQHPRQPHPQRRRDGEPVEPVVPRPITFASTATFWCPHSARQA